MQGKSWGIFHQYACPSHRSHDQLFFIDDEKPTRRCRRRYVQITTTMFSLHVRIHDNNINDYPQLRKIL